MIFNQLLMIPNIAVLLAGQRVSVTTTNLMAFALFVAMILYQHTKLKNVVQLSAKGKEEVRNQDIEMMTLFLIQGQGLNTNAGKEKSIRLLRK
jgi:hypothetical protein